MKHGEKYPMSYARIVVRWLLALAFLPFTNSIAMADTYVANLQALFGTTTSGVVTMGGYYDPGDGGGGTLVPSQSKRCATNSATIFKDGAGYCLYRVNPTNNLREWGAKCDVVVVKPLPNAASPTTATWNPTLVDTHMSGVQGAIVVSSSLLPPPPLSPPLAGTVNAYPAIGKYITISQVGGPTLWVNSGTTTAQTTVSATHYSMIGSYANAQMKNYAPGQLISFMGNANTGSFSQQVAIIVDSVKSVTISGITYNGVIDQWHFLWGGLYDPTNLPTSTNVGTGMVDGTMVADPQHSYPTNPMGSNVPGGAVLTPAWSGWSLLNNQTIGVRPNGSLPYKVGDTITLSQGTSDGSTVNQLHYPKLVVETVDGNGSVLTYDWLDYGSYYKLPNAPATLTSIVSSGTGTGFNVTSVQWTRGPLATKIADVQLDSTAGLTDIFVSENFTTNPVPYSGFPTTMPVQFFYYGDDDNIFINLALSSQSGASIATGNGAAFRLPGACGTTVSINLPQDSKANFVNPALIGGSFQSSGLYAFAAPLAGRAFTGGTPVMNRVVYGGFANAFGGGLRDLSIEAMGVPEGFGYYGMAQGTTNYPSPGGYVGPPAPLVAASPPSPIPTSGDAVEIDSGKYLRIRNVHISDGGIGSGNSVVHCGIDESDPTGFLGNHSIGNAVVSDSRFDANPLFSGATDSDTTLRLGNSCHDSVYQGLTVYDGAKADLLDYNGNIFSQIHFGSEAVVNNPAAAATLVFTGANSGFAGVADFGAYSIQNTSFSQTQCDIANLACVRMASDSTSAYHNPGQITDTQMRCGALQSVPLSYRGVELGAGAANITVGGTTVSGVCHAPAAQLIVLDATPDQTVSLCDNSNALVTFCAGYQGGFAPGRAYTQPALGYTPLTTGVILSGAATGPTTLYAVPFINPGGGMLTRIGIYVTAPGGGIGAASMCELGVYASASGAPGALLLDAGPVPVTVGGAQTLTSQNFLVQPNTLYFLAVGCNGNVSVQGTTATNGPVGLLLGEPDYITFGATSATTSWSPFTANGLPQTFPMAIFASTANVPNVYVSP